jgi:C1A family cysteine protease
MKAVIIISLLLASAFGFGFEEQLMKDLYSQWKQTHMKLYGSAHEDEYRFNVFTENYLTIQEFNSQKEDSDDVELALNQFADLTNEEFGALHTGHTFSPIGLGETFVFDNTQDPPASVDWRSKGAVTPVKNQGSCGSCWAFSATGALEGLYYINNTQLISFSEQNLVDCVTQDYGCNGGWPIDAMSYSAQAGIQSESDYPYKGFDGKCAFDKSKAYIVNSGYYNVTPDNLEQMKLAVAQQPVSVGIQANGLVFQFYAGGVIKKLCGANIDHGVLVVGYDVIKGQEAYIVKNSWGGSWGNSGYVYISTDDSANKGNGVCGILKMPAIPYKN